VKEVEQVSNIRFWAQTGSVSERGLDSPQVNFRGIQDEHVQRRPGGHQHHRAGERRR